MSSKILVCSQCGYVGKSEGAIKGSIGVEIVLWLCFIIPGLIYSVWRSSSRHNVCPKCKSPSLIPMDTPKAQKIMNESMSKEEIEKTVLSEKNNNLKENKRQKIIMIVAIVATIVFVTFLNFR